IAPVTPACNHYSVCIERRLSLNPIQERLDILNGVEPFISVIKFEKCLAIPGRTSDVRVNLCDAEFVNKVIVRSIELRTGLIIRASVDIDYHWTLAGKSLGWSIKES